MTTRSAPKRAPRGSGKNRIGVLAELDPEIVQAIAERAAALGITKRAFISDAIVRELTDPTISPAPTEQEELPLYKTA